jgi:tRNA A-37 threonylcarbamoyl transferase component Bud32/TolB-like protein
MDDTLARLTAALAGRYTIEKLAGEGGMATVYRATDLKHHRPVAIKVLRPELAATVGSDRFLQEIELSARLQHPHIIPLYDSGDAGGVLYYVMPFIEGESLRDRLRAGKLPFEEAVSLTREVASALGYAHAQGIVHRDIKPENIMISNGHAVVADFGIARALRVAAEGQGSNMTGLGFAIGTPAYMSPEQATASEVDGRSDQYSLAAMFYEMVSGHQPFTGPTAQAVLTQVLTGPRPRLSKVTREAPAEADAPVQRALASDPANRYPTVLEFSSALEHAAGGGSGAVAERRKLKRLAIGLPVAVAVAAGLWIAFGPSRSGPVVKGAESIAVLPFNTSGPGVELMGEGMVDLLSTNLNAVGGIRAADPRTVLARWKKSGGSGGADLETALAVARGVKASAAVLGSIVATGNRVRVSADLYGQDGKALAHAQVDGAADSVLPLVDSLSLYLVRDIWRSREPLPTIRVSGLTTGSLAAMREYLTGEQFYRHSEWDSAASHFDLAVQQDSTFALAHYRLAMAIGWKGGYNQPRAKTATAAALRFSTRLQPRERALITAYDLFSKGQLAAIDSMQKYTAAFPDDIEGWNLLGETQYHTRQLTGLDDATLERPFDRVLALDSTLSPVAIHPIELTLSNRDERGYQRYMAVMQKYGDPVLARMYAAAGALAFHNTFPDTANAVELGRHGDLMLSVFTGSQDGPNTGPDSVLNALNQFSRVMQAANPNPQFASQFVSAKGWVYTGLGQFGEAQRLVDSLGPAGRDPAGGIILQPIMLGYAPPEYGKAYMDKARDIPIQNPFHGYLMIAVNLSRGDLARSGRLLDSLSRDSLQMPSFLRGAYRGARGWHTVLKGDTLSGLKDLRAGAEQIGYGQTFFSAPIRLQLATTLASRPATRDEGLRMLRNGFDGDIGVKPIALFALGKAEELANQKDSALAAYGQFLRLWSKADSLGQPRVQEARDAIARLTKEKS